MTLQDLIARVEGADRTKTKRLSSYAVQRRSLWSRGHRNCYWCDQRLTMASDQPNTLTLDHKVPLARGGLNKPFNYVAACKPCNNAKGSMLEADFWRFVRPRRTALQSQEAQP